MAKPKSPLLSLGARGTIGDTLTFQKRGKEHIVREKPIPKDPYSLNQAYQRWDYRDYAYLWTLLSNSEKQVYRTKASRYHITGFSQYMRENLKALTSIVGRWHLDEKAGAIAYDSSKNNINGTIFGASPATGIIAGGYSFDGINDYIDLGNAPSGSLLDLRILFTVDSFVRGASTDGSIVERSTAYNIPGVQYTLRQNGTTAFYFVVSNGAAWVFAIATLSVVEGQIYHLAGTYDNLNARIYVNGTLRGTSANLAGPLHYVNSSVKIGGLQHKFDNLIDHVIINDRVKDSIEILRQSQRRYP